MSWVPLHLWTATYGPCWFHLYYIWQQVLCFVIWAFFVLGFGFGGFLFRFPLAQGDSLVPVLTDHNPPWSILSTSSIDIFASHVTSLLFPLSVSGTLQSFFLLEVCRCGFSHPFHWESECKIIRSDPVFLWTRKLYESSMASRLNVDSYIFADEDFFVRYDWFLLVLFMSI